MAEAMAAQPDSPIGPPDRKQLCDIGRMDARTARNMAVPIEARASFHDLAQAVTKKEMATSPYLGNMDKKTVINIVKL